MGSSVLIFTDLDGCLLNKADYRYDDALPVLQRLSVAQIPVVLCSSKTRSEMSALQEELSLSGSPMTCENGGGDRVGDVEIRRCDCARTRPY